MSLFHNTPGINTPGIDPGILEEAHAERLLFLASVICEKEKNKIPDLLKYWKESFPACTDYDQLQELGAAYRDNDWRPLRSTWLDSSVELDLVSPNNPILKRMYNYNIYLKDNEAVVVHDRQIYGPMLKQNACHFEKQLKAQSPVATPEGYLLSPDID